jgi:predicted negative regulator of RcsB-dependent stress response
MGNAETTQAAVEEEQPQWKKMMKALWKDRIFVVVAIIMVVLLMQYRFWSEAYHK